MEVVLLGSGGWIPTSRRATCSALARDGRHALLIDAGTGVGRLVENPRLLEGVEALDVVLTHFHLDHVVGLCYLPALASAPPRLYGPGAWLYGRPTAEIVAQLIGPPLFALGPAELFAEIGELKEGGSSLGPFELQTRAQRRHDDPTAALRLGNELAYCTDTAYDEANVAFSAGCRVLAHEAWCTEDDRSAPETHSSAREAARIARDAAVDRLALIHVRPGADESRLVDEAQSTFERAAVGQDLLPL